MTTGLDKVRNTLRKTIDTLDRVLRDYGHTMAADEESVGWCVRHAAEHLLVKLDRPGVRRAPRFNANEDVQTETAADLTWPRP